MPDITAFRGLRYNLSHVGSLHDVVAPIVDQMSDAQVDALYKRHPANIVRLTNNRDEPGDVTGSASQRVSRFCKRWEAEGVLRREGNPAIYVYEQHASEAKQSDAQCGIVCCMGLEPLGENLVYPLFESDRSAVAKSLSLARASRANLSPVVAVGPESCVSAVQHAQSKVRDGETVETVDSDGRVHRLSPVTDEQTISDLQRMLASAPVFLAHGQSQYEAFIQYRSELKDTTPMHVGDSIMALILPMNESVTGVRPAECLFHVEPGLMSNDWIQGLGDLFMYRPLTLGTEPSQALIREHLDKDDDSMILFSPGDRCWTMLTPTPKARQEMQTRCSRQPVEYQRMGIQYLRHLVLNAKSLTIDSEVRFVQSLTELMDSLAANASPNGRATAGAVFAQPRLSDLEAIVASEQRIPARTVALQPPMLNGLVINPLF